MFLCGTYFDMCRSILLMLKFIDSRSWWQCVLRRGSAATWLLVSRLRIPLRTSVVFVVCCVGSSPYEGLITCAEESYRVCVCVCVCVSNCVRSININKARVGRLRHKTKLAVKFSDRWIFLIATCCNNISYTVCGYNHNLHIKFLFPGHI